MRIYRDGSAENFIEFSSYFFHRLSEEEQKHIFLHEIAHCIQVESAMPIAHDKNFRQICEKIGCLAPKAHYTQAEKKAIKKAESLSLPKGKKKEKM